MKREKLWLFNPHCELSIAKEQTHFTPPKAFKSIQNDLSVLLLWVMGVSDSLLVDNGLIRSSWKRAISSIFKYEITILTPKDIKKSKDKFNVLNVWGRSPSLLSDINTIKAYVNHVPEWETSVKSLFHRKVGYSVLQEMISSVDLKNVVTKDELGVFCTSSNDVEVVISNIFFNNKNGVILKLPYSSSGRGILVMKREEVTPSIQKWIESGLNQQGAILVEPLLEKVEDFSLLFQKDKESNVHFLGGTSFISGPTGQYYGAKLKGFDTLFSEIETVELNKCINFLKHKFEAIEGYSGFIGVDAILYNQNDQRKIHPCIEINPRMTMGHITLGIENKLMLKTKGTWRIVTKQEVENFHTLEEDYQSKYPLCVKDGKIYSGFLPLVDVDSVKNYYAYLLVSNEEI